MRWLTVFVTVDLSSPNFMAISIRDTPGDCHKELMIPAVLVVRLSFIDKTLVSKSNLTMSMVLMVLKKTTR
ncbi:hypothetical protein A1OQ_11390 [Enterovibrio norvegicus FF-162]|nr:hypothetical protein A1OQ_11390 [Enterovibrio norvegicus FF-162]